MGKTVTVIRHAETNANQERRWQGTTDSGMSRVGFDQIERLAKRFTTLSPDFVVASDLPRTMRTAEALGGAEPDPEFREFSVGDWEGLTSVEVAERFPVEWEAFVRGEDVAPGGGEQMSVFRERVGSSFDRLVDRMDDGDHAVLVTHGGVIWSLMSLVLGLGKGAAMIPSHNTAFSQVIVSGSGERRIEVFNDATHLDEAPNQFGPEGRHATFVRHGQSFGNVAGRWDSTTDTDLTELGKEQAALASVHVPAVKSLYSSPLKRTSQTAEIIGAEIGTQTTHDDGLVEMFFGAWEGLTTSEILERHGDDIAEFESGNGDDTARGGNGESLTGAGSRMRDTTHRLSENSVDGSFVAVSHGAAIRALAVNVLGVQNAGRGKLAIPRNTAQSKLVLTDSTVVLGSYNVAPHMEA